MEYLILTAATYFITLLLTEQTGPFRVFFKLRQHIKPLDCFTCTSFWVALAMSVGYYDGLNTIAVMTLAIAGLANLLDRFTY